MGFKELTKKQKITIGSIVGGILLIGGIVGVVLACLPKNNDPKDSSNDNPTPLPDIYGREITQEVVNRTLSKFYENSRASIPFVAYEGELENKLNQLVIQNMEYVSVTNDGKITFLEKCIQTNKLQFKMSEVMTAMGASDTEVLSYMEGTYGTFTNEGDIYTQEKSVVSFENYFHQINDYSFEKYTFDDDKFYKTIRVGDVKNTSFDLFDLLPSLIGHGTYNEDTHKIHIINSDLKPNDKYDYFDCYYDVIIENGLISNLTLFEQQENKENDKHITETQITYGGQTITLPGEELLKTCSHEDKDTKYKEVNGSYYSCSECDECDGDFDIEQIELDENGFYPNGDQPEKEEYLSYCPKSLIEVDYNPKTKKIIRAIFSAYKRYNKLLNNYSYVHDGLTEDNSNSTCKLYDGLGDNNYAWVTYGEDSSLNYVLLKNYIVDDAQKTISGEELVKLRIGDVFTLTHE